MILTNKSFQRMPAGAAERVRYVQLTMQRCPHCRTEIILRELPHQGLFRSDRVCPQCNGNFTVDTDTKRRQALFIITLLISLFFTLLLYYNVTRWLILARTSYLALGLLLYWSNKKVFLVPYNNAQDKTKDT